MSSIIRDGDAYHGISVFGRGVFTNDEDGRVTYAGQCKDGYACGLGVATSSDGSNGWKVYAEHGPDGKYVGRRLVRWADGLTIYFLFERGEEKDWTRVSADGRCAYKGVACAPDDPRLLALIAQVAPVEVRPAAPAPHPPLLPTRPQAIVRWISRLFLPPQALAKTVATEVHPHAARRRWSPCRHNPTTAALYRVIVSPRSILAGLCSFGLIPFGFGRPRKPWPICHCAWRCACTAATKFGGVL
jgi:hypothetical protein